MIEFTDSQKKVISNGLTILSLVVVFTFTAFVAWLMLKLLAFTAPAIVPVIIGFFLSLLFKPYYRWCLKYLRNPTLTLIVMLTTVFLPLGLILWHVGAMLIDQIANLIAQGPQLLEHVTNWFQTTFPKLNALMAQLGFTYNGLNDFYVKYAPSAIKAGSGALKCASGVLSALLTLIFFVTFLAAKDHRSGEMVGHLPFLKPATQAFLTEQVNAFTDILVSFFQRQTIICLIEGVMYGFGFAVVGLPYGFTIGFILGVLNLIPFFGSLVCLPFALPLAYFTQGGSLTRLLLVLGVWLLGQGLDGYLITPKIQGNKTGLGYGGVIFSFFFWSTVLGPLLGMLLAIPLSAFCVVFWRALKSQYIRPLV